MDNQAYPPALEQLMEMLRGLPGVGKRSAERMALQFHKWDAGRLASLAELLSTLKERVGTCPQCGGMSSGRDELCPVCASPKRDRSVICVVEETTQLRSIESSGMYHGLYHILGGRIAPLEGKTAESLTTGLLLKRLEDGTVKEIILALSPDVEGQATSVYLAGLLQGRNIKISRPAQGLPAGSDLSYADPATITAAFNGRTDF